MKEVILIISFFGILFGITQLGGQSAQKKTEPSYIFDGFYKVYVSSLNTQEPITIKDGAFKYRGQLYHTELEGDPYVDSKQGLVVYTCKLENGIQFKFINKLKNSTLYLKLDKFEWQLSGEPAKK